MSVVSEVASFLCRHIASILTILFLSHYVRNYFARGVSSIPGPFWAKFTNLWRYLDVARGHAENTHIDLHRRYGQYVRIGPNVVSVCNIDALKNIYGINKGYQKTGFYEVQQQLVSGRPTPTLFTSRDENFHSAIKRPISSAYSMTTLSEFEVFVDKTIRTMIDKLSEYAADGRVCDMAAWLQYYAFDVIGELTFSKPLGFLEQGRDIDGIIKSLEKNLDYVGKVGQMPWLDQLMMKNPVRRMLGGGSTGPAAKFARKRLDERLNLKSNGGNEPQDRRDFLSRFLEAKKTHPQTVNDAQVLSYTISNVNAGSDTTAISLRAVLYYTLKHPRVLEKLVKELEDAYDSGRMSIPVTWKESQQLPYLDAVIKEAFRLHPAVGLLLERIVPQGGLQLPDGPFLPPGTVVGVNAWAIHRHPVFGEDLDSFIPERWLPAEGESEETFEARRQEMASATFTFGAGPRTCIGKNISLLEVYKLIPSLFYTFKFELTKPDAEWETFNAWFVRQTNMDMRISKIKR
ncbi:cytochrome P450 [Hypoxylon sp. EC38]|nr:cytochrome P450 [Hypoxylon sp. EC38]